LMKRSTNAAAWLKVAPTEEKSFVLGHYPRAPRQNHSE